MKRTKNKKKRIAVLSFAAICTLLLATFAWELYQDSVENKFGNALISGSVKINEKFEDPHLAPGEEKEKNVWLTNTSSSNLLVRATFEERLRLLVAEADGSAKLEKIVEKDITQGTYLPTANPKAIPVVVDGKYYIDAALANSATTDKILKDWVDITNKVDWTDTTQFPTGQPSDVKVFAKLTQTKTTDVNNNTIYNYKGDFIAFRKFDLANSNMGDVSKDIVVKYPGSTTHIAARVNGDKDNPLNIVVGTKTDDPDSFTFTFNNYHNEFYTGLNTGTDLNWSTKNIHVDDNKPTYPIASYEASLADSNIEYGFSGDMVTTVSQSKKWFFNKDDGYFYYLDILASGSNSPEFLNSVALKGDVKNVYDYLDYSLFVDGEGILVNQLSLDENWDNLVTQSAVTGSDSEKLYNLYKTIIATP